MDWQWQKPCSSIRWLIIVLGTRPPKAKVDECPQHNTTAVVCCGPSGKGRGIVISWSSPGVELAQVAGEAARQTWKAQTSSAGEMLEEHVCQVFSSSGGAFCASQDMLASIVVAKVKSCGQKVTVTRGEGSHQAEEDLPGKVGWGGRTGITWPRGQKLKREKIFRRRSFSWPQGNSCKLSDSSRKGNRTQPSLC